MNKAYEYLPSENPFTLKFGSIPPLYIEPENVISDIMSRLTSKYVTDNCFIITGVRGSGKTVTMTDIVARTREIDEFIVVRIPTTEDILTGIVGQLYDTNEFVKDFIKTNLNLSKFGIGLSVEQIEPVSDLYASMLKIMDSIKKKNKRLLIAIDEVSKTKDVERFGKQFNALSSEGYPIFLIMTGLPENVTRLEDSADLTFLRRAVKKVLEPLNRTLIRRNYENTFHISMEKANELAFLTKGYPTAYQLLGQILWNKKPADFEITDEILKDYDDFLEAKVYASIWKSLTEKEKMYLCCMTEKSEMTVSEVLALAKSKSGEFSQYKERLIRKGLVDNLTYGKISLTLPRFDAFIKNMIILEHRFITG